MKERQAAKIIYDHYKISETEGALLELQDLLQVTFKSDNLRAFLNDWEHVPACMNPAPTDAIMET